MQSKADDEACGHDPHGETHILCSTYTGSDDHITDEPHAETRGDTARERHGDDGKKGRQSFSHVAEINIPHFLNHERAHHDERGSRGVALNNAHQRRKHQTDKKKYGHSDGGKSGTPPSITPAELSR